MRHSFLASALEEAWARLEEVLEEARLRHHRRLEVLRHRLRPEALRLEALRQDSYHHPCSGNASQGL